MNCPRCLREIPEDAVICCYCSRTIIKKAPSKIHQRANGTGTAYKRGKTWTAVITSGWFQEKNGNIKQKRLTKGGFKTKTDALEYCLKIKKVGKYETTKPPTLFECWDLFRTSKLQKVSKSKQIAYQIAWKKLKEIWSFPINKINAKTLIRIVHEQSETYYPARDMKTLLKQLFRLASADGWANKDLPDFIVLPKNEEKARDAFTKEEQERMWQAYESGDNRVALALIMIYTGMMPGEMRNLKKKMIDFESKKIFGVGMKTDVRKASPVYIPEDIITVLADEVERSLPKSEYVWVRTMKKFYDTYYAGIEAAGCRRLTPYSCRHTTATRLSINEMIAPSTIKKIMRWSTTKMLDRYTHPSDEDIVLASNTLKR